MKYQTRKGAASRAQEPQILIPFGGEKMTCILCGKVQKSDPETMSDWRAVQLESDIFYACVDEFPPDGASKEEYEAAYSRFLEEAVKKRLELVAQRRETILRSVRGPNGKMRRIRHARN